MASIAKSLHICSLPGQNTEDNQKQVHRLRVLVLVNEFLSIHSDEPVRSLRVTQLLSTINQMCRTYYTRFSSLELHSEIIEKIDKHCSWDVRLLNIGCKY